MNEEIHSGAQAPALGVVEEKSSATDTPSVNSEVARPTPELSSAGGEVVPAPFPPDSPLALVDPAAIDELFSRDPLQMKDADIDEIIAHLRRERSKWETAEARAAAKKEAKLNPSSPVAKISLDDLGL